MDLEQVPSPASLGPDGPPWKFHGSCLMESPFSLFNFFLYTMFKVFIEFVAVLL